MRPQLEAPALTPDAAVSVPGRADSAELDAALRVVEAELASPMGRADRVQEACHRLRSLTDKWTEAIRAGRFASLASLAACRAGPCVEPVVAFLLDVAEDADPTLLEPFFGSPTPAVALEALDRAARLAAKGFLDGPRVAALFATFVESPGSPFTDREALARIALLLREPGDEGGQARLDALFSSSEDPRLRRLSARLLDLSPSLPSVERVRRTLGKDAARFLAPYLEFTRATHLDLLDLSPFPGQPPSCLPSLRHAEEIFGEALLRDVLSAFGWHRVNVGLEVHPFVGVSWNGSFPLLLTPAEGRLLEDDLRARKVFERWIVVAHGGASRLGRVATAGDDPVERFRGLNLLQADALGEILDLSPLTADKVGRIISRIDRIVEEFCGLFAAKEPDECGVVADVHRGIKERIEREMAATPAGRPVSAEVTRLVQLFEDPQTAGEIRTFHGLKRYLHQKGLQLGFRIAEMGRGTDRTVDFAILDGLHLGPVVQAVEYVDFEEEQVAAGPLGIPWPVWVAVDGLSRQLLFRQQRLPKVKAFCYGNEVHYFVGYRNHPLFLRVDFAPPLRGGMLDLEFFGVSKHELDSHPNPSLDGVGRFFRRLDVEVQIENTRIHARYDKERAADLSDLCEKVEALFRLAPYLMDIDWTIGDLALDAGARARVSEAWADFFARWGVLPVEQLLTSDRVGILAAVEADPSGPREVRWDGRGPYRDRFGAIPGADLWEAFRAALERRGFPSLAGEEERPASQLDLERELLRPLREGIARGEWRETPTGLEPSLLDLFERRHETELFAELLVGGGPNVAASARVAWLASALERHLRFETTGSVNGYEVQRARLPLRGEAITLFILRDDASVIRLAFFTLDGPPYRRRSAPSEPWQESAALDTEILGSRLRRNNLPVSCGEATSPDDAEVLRISFFTPNPHEEPPHLPGERVVHGIAAAPGVATGLACLSTAGRQPADVDGAILIAASVRPEDGPLLLGSAGVVSTGGGVLSHAGLLAMQYGKPALVTGGRWEETPGAAPTVVCRRTEFEESVTLTEPLKVVERRAWREIEERIREGDLLVVDADAGVLRLLGQDRDALALHDGLRQLLSSTRTLATATVDDQVLALRGRRLRALHQLERLFDRMEDPVLARHAARELLAGQGAGQAGDPATLLRRLLANLSVGRAALEASRQIAADLGRRHAASFAEAVRLVSTSDDPLEILFLRRDVRQLEKRLEAVVSCLAASGQEAAAPATDRSSSWFDLDGRAFLRLSGLRASLVGRMAVELANGRCLRHRLAFIERLDEVLQTPPPMREALEALRRQLEEDDAATRQRLAGRRIVTAADGGLELRPLAGSKAASLAEIDRLGAGKTIPAWFAVTDRAFREVLDSPAPQAAQLAGIGAGLSLQNVIAHLLADSSKSPETRSSLIRRAWEMTPLPPGLAVEVADAYGRLADTADKPDPFVAIRSSALEEDTEKTARAGEFDTFLFVRGVPAVLDRLRLAWAGLWTPRAIRNRESMGGGDEAVGGGVLVQRMIDARASGVLHTVNVAAGRPREMLINAGLGLGEGVVSGLVAADQVTVEKDAALSGEEIHVRYLTCDKRERVIFDARSGSGTTRVETLYHQRLRPALEYVELCELVHSAARLEAALSLPLDVEFAVDSAGLHLLQVRPVPAAVAVWRETAECIPFRHGGPS